MINFFKNVFNMNEQPKMETEELNYLVSVLNSTSSKAHNNERVRASVLSVARRVRNAVRMHDHFSTTSRRSALVALNKVKIHALASGTPKDYTFFLQLDRITRELEVL